MFVSNQKVQNFHKADCYSYDTGHKWLEFNDFALHYSLSVILFQLIVP